jgi:hypothetical protein
MTIAIRDHRDPINLRPSFIDLRLANGGETTLSSRRCPLLHAQKRDMNSTGSLPDACAGRRSQLRDHRGMHRNGLNVRVCPYPFCPAISAYHYLSFRSGPSIFDLFLDTVSEPYTRGQARIDVLWQDDQEGARHRLMSARRSATRMPWDPDAP